MTNKKFWKKPFLTNKGRFSEDQISIKVNDELVLMQNPHRTF